LVVGFLIFGGNADVSECFVHGKAKGLNSRKQYTPCIP
jgi:hypothetical protein